MAANSYKAREISATLADSLRARGFGSLTLTEGFDTDGYPYISIGAGAALGRNAIIKTTQQSNPLAKDAFGNTANAFGPHVIQLCYETNFAGTTDNVPDTLTASDLAGLYASIYPLGCAVQVYQTATGVAPTLAAIVAGNLKTTQYPDPFNPVIAQV